MPVELIETFTLKPGSYPLQESSLPPGILMRIGPIPVSLADAKNANGRIYKESLWRRVCEDEKIRGKVASRGMLGELDHPDTDRGTKLERVSHVIPELMMKGKKVYQTFEIVDTPMGRIAAALVRAKIPVGVSTRGFGDTVQEAEGNIVDEDSFVYETTDFVAEPSACLYASLPESQKAPLRRALVESIQMDTKGQLREYHRKLVESLEGTSPDDTEDEDDTNETDSKNEGNMPMTSKERLAQALESFTATLATAVSEDDGKDALLARLSNKKESANGKTESDSALEARVVAAVHRALEAQGEAPAGPAAAEAGEASTDVHQSGGVAQARLSLANQVIEQLRDMVLRSTEVVESLAAENMTFAKVIEDISGEKPACLAEQYMQEVALGGGPDPDGDTAPDGIEPEDDDSNADPSLGGLPDPDGETSPDGQPTPEEEEKKDDKEDGKSDSESDDDSDDEDAEDDEDDDEEEDQMESANPTYAGIKRVVEQMNHTFGGLNRTGGDRRPATSEDAEVDRMTRLMERTTGRKSALNG